MVRHREVDLEPNALAMMATVAGDAEREDDTACREIKHLRTVELYDVEGGICSAISSSATALGCLRLLSLRTNTLG